MRSNPTCQHTPTRGYQGTVSIHGSLGTGAFSNSPALYLSLTSPRTVTGPPPPVDDMVLGTPSPYPSSEIRAAAMRMALTVSLPWDAHRVHVRSCRTPSEVSCQGSACAPRSNAMIVLSWYKTAVTIGGTLSSMRAVSAAASSKRRTKLIFRSATASPIIVVGDSCGGIVFGSVLAASIRSVREAVGWGRCGALFCSTITYGVGLSSWSMATVSNAHSHPPTIKSQLRSRPISMICTTCSMFFWHRAAVNAWYCGPVGLCWSLKRTDAPCPLFTGWVTRWLSNDWGRSVPSSRTTTKKGVHSCLWVATFTITSHTVRPSYDSNCSRSSPVMPWLMVSDILSTPSWLTGSIRRNRRRGSDPDQSAARKHSSPACSRASKCLSHQN